MLQSSVSGPAGAAAASSAAGACEVTLEPSPTAPAPEPDPAEHGASDGMDAEVAPDPAPRTLAARVSAVRSALVGAGGFSMHGELAADTSRRAIAAAVRAGVVVNPTWGVYALPTDEVGTASPGAEASVRSAQRAERVGAHRRWAASHRVTLSHRSAAEYHGLDLWVDPTRPEGLVKRGTRRDPALRHSGDLRTRLLLPTDYADGVTSPLRTVIDCAADLPFAQGLAVADSAVRPDGDAPPLVGITELLEAAARAPTRIRTKVRRVAECADPGAANAFESALRAIALDVPGLSVETQVVIRTGADEWLEGDGGDVEPHRVDLADRRLRLVLEADSYEWHGNRAGFVRDCWRYSCLVADGWLVVRFTWDAVRHRPDAVRALLERLVALRTAELTCRACGHVQDRAG